MSSRSHLSLALMASLSLAASGSAGQVPNPLTDRLIEQPLRDARSVWDVFRAVHGFLAEVYPAEGPARAPLTKMGTFIQDSAAAKDADESAGRAVEMPIGIDSLMAVLRADAPGVDGRSLTAALQGNPKARLYLSAILPFLQMRGITYRLRPLVAQSSLLHHHVVNQLRETKQGLRYGSGTNGLAVFQFLTYPLAAHEREPVQFSNVNSLQLWVRKSLLPTLDASIALAEGALKDMGAASKESVDLSLFLQAENPFPNQDFESAHRHFGAGEVQNYVARLYYNRARLRLFLAYNLDEGLALSNKLRNVYFKAFLMEKLTLASLFDRPRTGSPPVVRYRVTQQFAKFLTVADAGQGPAALADLRAAWKHYDAGMQKLFQGSKNESGRIVNMGLLQATERDYHKKVAPQISQVLAGPASVADYVGGATVDIDLPGLLNNLPGDLKAFFPTAFIEEQPYFKLKGTEANVTYTNYDFGTPVGWDLAGAGGTWQRVFPTIPVQANAEGNWDAPMVMVRDLARTYVGRALAPLFASVVY